MEIIYALKVIWDRFVKSVIYRPSNGGNAGLKMEDIVVPIVLK
jgi:hypothetical protein